MSQKRVSGKSANSVILSLFPLVLLGPLSMDMYLPALPMMQDFFSCTTDMAQHTLSIFIFAFGVSQIFIANLVARSGRRQVLIFSLLLFALASISCFFSDNIYVFLFSRLLQAFSACGSMVVTFAWINDLCHDREKSRSLFSLISATTALAPILAPVMGTLLLRYFPWQMIFILLALYSFFSLLVFLYSGPDDAGKNKSPHVSSYQKVLCSLKFWNYSIITGGMMSFIFIYFSVSPYLLMGHFHLNQSQFSLAFAVCASGFLAGSLLSPKIQKKICLEKLIYIILFCLLITGIILIVFSLDVTTFCTLMFFAELLFGLCFGSSVSEALSDFQEESDHASSVHGFQQFFVSSVIGFIAINLSDNNPHDFGLIMSTLSTGLLILYHVISGMRRKRRYIEKSC
ncbi:MAG: multidrug effflux MFS transporter [Deltaproteobacteria bacterium]|nr:multidrug effflux MFS transporter [Deltaproteobacteria bacterium]